MGDSQEFYGDTTLLLFSTFDSHSQSQIREIAFQMTESLVDTMAFMIGARHKMSGSSISHRSHMQSLFESWHDEMLNNCLKAKRQMLRSISDFKFNVGNTRHPEKLFMDLDVLADTLRENSLFKCVATNSGMLKDYLCSTVDLITGDYGSTCTRNLKDLTAKNNEQINTLSVISNTYMQEVGKPHIPGLILNSTNLKVSTAQENHFYESNKENNCNDIIKKEKAIRSYAVTRKNGLNSKEGSNEDRENSQPNSPDKQLTSQARDIQLCEFQTESLMELSPNRFISPNVDREELEESLSKLGFSERKPSSRFEVAITQDPIKPLPHFHFPINPQLCSNSFHDDALNNYMTFSNNPPLTHQSNTRHHHDTPPHMSYSHTPALDDRASSIVCQTATDTSSHQLFDVKAFVGCRKAEKINVNIGTF